MPNEGDAREQLPPESPRPESAAGTPVSAIEQNLMRVAEELGAWLGTAERKTTDLLAQQNLREQLVKIRDTAARLIAQVEKGRERTR
jgi:hypothetical protein